MVPEKPMAELYDFLYRDPVRIPSFYAQLFGGRLATVEQLESSRDAKERSGRGSIGGFVSGEVKGTDDKTVGRKEVYDAADLLVGDVLARLSQTGRLNADYGSAPTGSLIIASGAVAFVDQSALKIGRLAFEAEAKEVKSRPGTHKSKKEQTAGLDMVAKLMDAITLPSMFVMKTDSGIIAGQIRDDGMSEPISAHYFKYGDASMTDVFVVGIKEVPGPTIQLPEAAFFTATMGMAQVLTKMTLPESATRITPLALFRKHA